MPTVVPILIAIGLLVYCLIDAGQADGRDVRVMPRVAWLVAIVLVPVIGPLGWLLAGRPRRPAAKHDAAHPTEIQQRLLPADTGMLDDSTPEFGLPRMPVGPDDDPEFIEELGRRAEELRRQQPPS